MDNFKDEIMKADAFDQIYMIISNHPQKIIDTALLCQGLSSKKLKVTNRMIAELRESVRPEIIDNLQENLTNSQKFIGNTPNFRLKFLN